ncbi:DUF3482 domain-containing protein [Yanghanlia caeni]|uniref:DUF3482 domain-containing protein n=1 Tax=Yanghanlia caeni TaxID=3064283 RepID=A0ABU1D6K9_9BURK|nr:DUF3482 domain-containing protein [Alcaligenaceae bacterium LG-2]NGR06803.1 DUF3482 domain-containing protein [bacterium SGD-2]HZH55910.1 DUF3482 domain-containing protein [Burkholderiaceae bacterium]
MTPRPLRLAVVGHTNTGKTSLLRTLTRDPDFGEVSDSPGTTRHVEGVRLLADGAAGLELFDTPGMEDGMALLEYLERLEEADEKLDGPARIQRFLDSPESLRRFEQEARVLRKLLECDAGLYVVDVRDPVLAKHRDELAVLASCGHPLLPVLNFTRSPGRRIEEWRSALSRLGLHAVVEFDTVAPPLDGEDQLYDKLALMLDTHASLLRTLKQNIAEQRTQRHADAMTLVAEMLIDIAALRLSAEPQAETLERTAGELRRLAREREQRCVEALLKRFNFRPSDFPQHALPLEGERWAMDLFHPQALKDVGIHVGKGMAAGAMAGATLDMFMAGISLGAATLIGATAGGLWQGADKLGRRLLGRLRGYQEMTVDDPVLRLLALRGLALIAALERRGHAAQGPISIDALLEDKAAALRKDTLPEALQEARARPEWSTLTEQYEPSARRTQAVRQLAAELDA